ncbi:MAG: ATP-binding cassette domain-containing protein [Dissulfurispiraceae bacterium]
MIIRETREQVLNSVSPVMKAEGLTKIYGIGCPVCRESTGPGFETNMCRRCGSVVACGDISFELYPDEVLGIVGESGSGKSTLVKLLYFDSEATHGAIYINDSADNVLSLSPFQKRRIRNSCMGMVYQNPHYGLRMEVSSGGNISERLIMAGWRNIAAMRERASYLLKKTEIPVLRIDEPPANFSGGEQQRVQISKALSNNPLILFLDEVTTGLDLSVQARVLDLIRDLQSDLHLSVIVVSHDLGVIRLLTTRTMVMKYGRVVESGLTDQILEDPQHHYTQLLVSSQL